MSDTDQAKELLQIAHRELRALKGMLDAETFADELFGFVGQQVVEKSLKAWLCLLGLSFPFTHDLSDLLTRLEDAGQNVESLWNLIELNPFAVAFRYTSFGPEDAPVDRQTAIAQVESLMRKVEQLLQNTG